MDDQWLRTCSLGLGLGCLIVTKPVMSYSLHYDKKNIKAVVFDLFKVQVS